MLHCNWLACTLNGWGRVLSLALHPPMTIPNVLRCCLIHLLPIKILLGPLAVVLKMVCGCAGHLLPSPLLCTSPPLQCSPLSYPHLHHSCPVIQHSTLKPWLGFSTWSLR